MADGGLLHVLGGGPWQVPTVRLAKQLGYRVLITDIFPERPAHVYCDLHEVADITDPEATLAVARRHRIDGVICDTTDLGVGSAAYVAEALGLPGIGFDTALNCTRKHRLRKAVKDAGIASPPFIELRTELDLVAAMESLPPRVVVKPVDSQSSHGVSIVREPQQLAAAFAIARAASRAGIVLIEGHVDGVEIIVDGFATESDPVILGISSKVPNPDTPSVATRISYPAAFDDAVLRRIREVNRRTIAALGLRQGIFHAEYIVTDREVYPIDVAARGGGVNIYTHVIPAVSGVDANRCMIELAMGHQADIRPRAGCAANIEFLFAGPGTVESVEGVDEARAMPGVSVIYVNAPAGRRIGRLDDKNDRAGHIVTVGRTAQEAIERAADAKARIRVRLRKEAAL